MPENGFDRSEMYNIFLWYKAFLLYLERFVHVAILKKENKSKMNKVSNNKSIAILWASKHEILVNRSVEEKTNTQVFIIHTKYNHCSFMSQIAYIFDLSIILEIFVAPMTKNQNWTWLIYHVFNIKETRVRKYKFFLCISFTYFVTITLYVWRSGVKKCMSYSPSAQKCKHLNFM